MSFSSNPPKSYYKFAIELDYAIIAFDVCLKEMSSFVVEMLKGLELEENSPEGIAQGSLLSNVFESKALLYQENMRVLENDIRSLTQQLPAVEMMIKRYEELYEIIVSKIIDLNCLPNAQETKLPKLLNSDCASANFKKGEKVFVLSALPIDLYNVVSGNIVIPAEVEYQENSEVIVSLSETEADLIHCSRIYQSETAAYLVLLKQIEELIFASKISQSTIKRDIGYREDCRLFQLEKLKEEILDTTKYEEIKG